MRSFSNAVSLLRAALRHLGLIEDSKAATPPPDGPWRMLLSTLNSTFAVLGLGRFAAWCHERGVMPDAVTEAAIAGFESFLRERMLRANIRRHTGDLGKS